MLDGIPPAEALRRLARYLEDVQGEAEVHLHHRGVEIRMRIVPGEDAREIGPPLKEVEREILQAACEHADEVLSAEDLARLVGGGCEPNAHFRGLLSHLRKLRLLSGRPGEAGYQATEAAHRLTT